LHFRSSTRAWFASIPFIQITEQDHDQFTNQVIVAINASGEAFFQPSVYKGKRGMRISVSNWRTNERDVERTMAATLAAIDKVNLKVKGGL
jgi:hypothetical protein